MKSHSGDENIFMEASSSKPSTLVNNTTSSCLLTDGSTLLKDTRSCGAEQSLLKGSTPLRRSMPHTSRDAISKIPTNLVPNIPKKEVIPKSLSPAYSDQLLYFGRVPINSTQIYEIRICNPSSLPMELEAWTCSAPFSVPSYRKLRLRGNVLVQPRSFILLPVAFVPKDVNVFYGGLKVRWRGESVLLRLVGESFDLTKTF
jgi:hypothetical protein